MTVEHQKFYYLTSFVGDHVPDIVNFKVALAKFEQHEHLADIILELMRLLTLAALGKQQVMISIATTTQQVQLVRSACANIKSFAAWRSKLMSNQTNELKDWQLAAFN